MTPNENPAGCSPPSYGRYDVMEVSSHLVRGRYGTERRSGAHLRVHVGNLLATQRARLTNSSLISYKCPSSVY